MTDLISKDSGAHAREGAGITSVQAAARSLRALELIAMSAQPVKLSQIADELGVSEPSAFRLVRTMIDVGFVASAPGSQPGYVPTLRVVELGSNVLTRNSVRQVAAAELLAVAEAFQESITIAVPDEESVVFVERIVCGPTVEFYCDIGKRLPLHVGAAARAVLAHVSEEAFRRYVTQALRPYTPATTITTDGLVEDRERTRAVGYTISKGDVEVGISAVGVAFVSADGLPIGAASIASVGARWSEPDYVARGRQMATAAAKISERCRFAARGRQWA